MQNPKVFWMSSFFLALPLFAAEQQGYVPQPSAIRSEGVSQLFRLNPISHGARLNSEEVFSVQVSRTFANLWGYDTGYVIDAELVDDQARFGFTFLPQLRFDLGLSQRRFASTGTDALAIGFHDFFRLSQDGRLEAKRNNIRYAIPEYGVDFTRKNRNLIFSQQVELGLTWDLGSYTPLPSTLAVYGSHEFAEGNPYFTDTTDAGFQFTVAYPWDDWALYGSVSLSIFDRRSEVDLATYYQQWGWIGGVGWKIKEQHELLGQMMVYQPLFRELGQLSRNSYETHLIYRYWWDQLHFEATLIENIFWVYNSPDWGYTLGLGYDH